MTSRTASVSVCSAEAAGVPTLPREPVVMTGYDLVPAGTSSKRVLTNAATLSPNT